MPDLAPQVEPYSERLLFGGAISCSFPNRLQFFCEFDCVFVSICRNLLLCTINNESSFCGQGKDVSAIRDVPNYQEVFADPNRDESIIVELLEFEQDVSDNQSAVWFLQDLATEQDAGQPLVVDAVNNLTSSDAPFLGPPIVITAAVGQMAVSKGRQGVEAQNLLRVYLANIRLRNVNTDVLITVYEPLVISPHSESANTVGSGAAVPAVIAGCMPAGEIFRLVLSTFKIRDWSLFGC